METKSIPGYSNYSVSSNGDVVNVRGMVLRSHDSNGYRRISLMNDKGKRTGVDIHRLVISAWIGPIPKGMWINHKNGDKADNRVENLEITTPSENHRHAFKVLKRVASNSNPMRKRAIDILIANGFSQMDLARAFCVSQPAISQMIARG